MQNQKHQVDNNRYDNYDITRKNSSPELKKLSTNLVKFYHKS